MATIGELKEGHNVSSTKELMDKLNVTFESNKYWASGTSFESFEDALNYANENSVEPVTEKEKPEQQYENKISQIPFVTSAGISGAYIVRTLGMVRGSTVRAKHIGRDIMADLKNFVGGEIKGYTELLAEGREEAIYRMKQDAAQLGANAIVDVRFSSATIAGGAAEILAYGTAIIAAKEKSNDS